MNERIKKLAEQAGFGLWRDESWKPGDVIDWSCRYDDEFKKFAELILEDVMSICEDLGEKGMDGHYCVDAIAKKYLMHQWS